MKLTVFALALLLLGCEKKLNGFQLPTWDLQIGSHKITVEVADTPAVMNRGLMFRTKLADGAGMIFVYPAPQKVSFYMKNTKIPLSIGFVDSEGVLLEIRDMQPLDETPIPSASASVRYAIEVPQGWFARAGIKPGAKVTGLPK